MGSERPKTTEPPQRTTDAEVMPVHFSALNLRGLEVLLATLGGILLILGVTSGLTVAAVGWAVTGVASILLGEAILIHHLFPHLSTTRRWSEIAARMPGIRLLSDGGRTPPRLRGTVNDCSIVIDRVGGGWQVAVSAIHRDDLADVQLTLHPRNERPVGGGALYTGDKVFDQTFQVEGRLPESLLVLDERLRRRLRASHLEGLHVGNGRVYCMWPAISSASVTTKRIERMAKLARDLYGLSIDDLRDRARSTVLSDPNPEARARVLLTYQDHYVLDERDRAAVAEAARHPDPQVRVAAAGVRVATEENAPEAEGVLAEAVARGECDPWTLDAAVERLRIFGRPEVVRPAMQARLHDDGPLPTGVLVWTLAQPSSPTAQELCARLKRAPTRDVLAAITVLAKRGPQFEGTLVGLLAHENNEVVDRVIESLAYGGHTSAVAALHRVSRSLRHPRRLRYAAVDAIAAIRARGPTGGAGRLSLVDPTS
ncbi:MAG: hypothetical protein AAFV29_07600, partial [Myxococcota bacterium]